MAIVRKRLGVLPIYKGEWSSEVAQSDHPYSKLNQVSLFGSTFQSKIDNNTFAPAALIEEEGVRRIVFDKVHWDCTSNGTEAWLADARLDAMEVTINEAYETVEQVNQRTGSISEIECEEFLYAIVDAKGWIIWAIYREDGRVYQPKGIPEEARKRIEALEKNMDGGYYPS